jgi:hypothetical protein
LLAPPDRLHREDEEVHEIQSNSDEIDPDDPSLDPFAVTVQQHGTEEKAITPHSELPPVESTSLPPPTVDEFDPELFEMEGSTAVFCEVAPVLHG